MRAIRSCMIGRPSRPGAGARADEESVSQRPDHRQSGIAGHRTGSTATPTGRASGRAGGRGVVLNVFFLTGANAPKVGRDPPLCSDSRSGPATRGDLNAFSTPSLSFTRPRGGGPGWPSDRGRQVGLFFIAIPIPSSALSEMSILREYAQGPRRPCRRRWTSVRRPGIRGCEVGRARVVLTRNGAGTQWAHEKAPGAARRVLCEHRFAGPCPVLAEHPAAPQSQASRTPLGTQRLYDGAPDGAQKPPRTPLQGSRRGRRPWTPAYRW